MKSILKLLRKRGAGGFTLVEMVVSVALIAVLLIGMLMFVSPIVKTFNTTKTNLTADNVENCVQEYISRNLRYANRIAIFTNASAGDLTSGTYKDTITQMNSACGSLTDPNRAYELKCISLRYETTADGHENYFMYQEKVDPYNSGAIVAGGGRKVFSDCLYKDLYLVYKFTKPENLSYNPSTDPADKEFRNDVLQIDIKAYTDPNYNDLILYGTGLSDLWQIKSWLAMGGEEKDYNMKIYPDNPVDFEDLAVGASRDIFIYYIVRRSSPTTP